MGNSPERMDTSWKRAAEEQSAGDDELDSEGDVGPRTSRQRYVADQTPSAEQIRKAEGLAEAVAKSVVVQSPSPVPTDPSAAEPTDGDQKGQSSNVGARTLSGPASSPSRSSGGGNGGGGDGAGRRPKGSGGGKSRR